MVQGVQRRNKKLADFEFERSINELTFTPNIQLSQNNFMIYY